MYNLKVTREELLILEALLGRVRSSDLDKLNMQPDLYTRVYTKNDQIAAPRYAYKPELEVQHFTDDRMQYLKHFTINIGKID